MFLSIRWTAMCSLVAVCVGAMPLGQLSDGETDGGCLYEAMEAGQVEVRLIAANGAKSNMAFTNLTDEVLEIRLPDAVGAVPATKPDEQSTSTNQL